MPSMRSLRLINFVTILSLFLTAAPAPAPAPASNAEFIRANCEHTLHPKVCYQSLKPYANVVKKELYRLAKVSIGLSLTRNKFISSYVENLTRQAQPEPRAAEALSDCVSMLGIVERDMQNSVKQMQQLTGTGEELRYQLDNVLTWITAARTWQEDCTDGFEGVSNTALKADVFGRVEQAKNVTDIALDFVAALVDKAGPVLP
ncbi:pectinesterase inhibitor 7-like [Salvia hispanica]|uniref:pectinesterase inhibitor 7-like n=1 Tax=Salvia hispanica TaxID=49212 RepID=UPI00200920D7|nr:pectinesterase inhibitor 7-like [Salvia hispanica]